MPHSWSQSDDLAALYVYKFGTDKIGLTIDEIASRRGIKPASFRMRVSNYQALDGGEGLDHYSNQSRDIYNRFRNRNENDLRRLAFPDRF